MNTGFSSKKNVMRLTIATLILFLGRTFVDFQYVFPEMMYETPTALLSLVIYTAIFGVWIQSLLGMERDQRGWFVTSLVITAFLFLGISLSTTLVYCPPPCQTFWPFAEIINWLDNIFGAVTLVATFLYLRQNR
jgi:hypothetical protein